MTGCLGTDYIDDPVSPSAATRLVIMPSNVALQPNELVQLQALFVDREGNSTTATGVSWSSSDAGIVEISNTGLAVARQIGQARILAQTTTATSEAALISVVADRNRVARVEVAPQSAQSRPGETRQFTATAFNLNNQIISGRAVTWVSSNPNVATINATGLAMARSIGTASITATIDSIESFPATFSVASDSRTGTFVTRPGSGHPVQGTATLARQANGSLVLSFSSGFSSAGGPDVRVYLSTTNTVGSRSMSLGSLMRFSGAQSYNVPSGVQLSSYDWVIIHCEVM